MKLHRITATVTAAAAAAAAIAIASAGAVTHDSAVPATLSDDSQSIISNAHPASSDPAKVVHVTASKPPHVDPSLAWLVSRGGQAQVAFNNAGAVMAGDLEIESPSSTVANHLAFEGDARVVRS